MIREILLNILVFSIISEPIQANFNLKLHFCSLQCEKGCAEEIREALNETTAELKGYYWRDYYGVIPPDAYALGGEHQYPQTYIGLVFDPSRNGTFGTTIVEGLNYVYTVLHGSVTKVSSNIQILCTKEPGKLRWMKVTSENLKEVKQNHKFVSGGFHYEPKFYAHYIVKASLCHIKYVGFVTSLAPSVEYAVMDGTVDTSTDYLWLLYNTDPSPQKTKPKSFFKHYYKYSIRPDSIIPKFYKKLVIGSCQIVCTNMDKVGAGDLGQSKMAKYAQVYYWKPLELFDDSEALPVGINRYTGKTTFLGRAYLQPNILDIGTMHGHSDVEIRFGYSSVVTSFGVQVLCTDQSNSFEWVNTTSTTLTSLDMTRMIIGGSLGNGTKVVVGREIETNSIDTASIHLLKTEALAFIEFGVSRMYQVLLVKDMDKKM